MPNNFRHDAIIDMIIACPHLTKGEIAYELGYTQAWLSTLMKSDAFQMQLAQRRAQLEDNLIHARSKKAHELDEAASKIIEKELAKENADPHYALSVKKILNQGLGASRQAMGMHIQNMQVVQDNRQINHSILEKARKKMRRIEEVEDVDDDFVASVVSG